MHLSMGSWEPPHLPGKTGSIEGFCMGMWSFFTLGGVYILARLPWKTDTHPCQCVSQRPKWQQSKVRNTRFEYVNELHTCLLTLCSSIKIRQSYSVTGKTLHQTLFPNQTLFDVLRFVFYIKYSTIKKCLNLVLYMYIDLKEQNIN